MKITSKRIKVIIERHNQLINLAESYVYSIEGRSRTIRFTDDGNIEKYVNTACHCHPEYEWIYVSTIESFGEWLDKNPN